jgi:glycine/D-amino acid oxidase-like deaminating enzyme
MSKREGSGPLHYENSLWHHGNPKLAASGPFEPDANMDFVVVGGGIAGAVLSLRLCQAGARVALLETESPGAGASGRSAGFIVPALSVVRPQSLLDAHGDRGMRLLRAVASSGTEFFALAKEFASDSDAVQRGWFHPTHDEPTLERVAQDCEVWKSLGADVSMESAAATCRLTGVKGYAGALFAPSGGTVNPVRFITAILRSAIARGLRFFPHTRADSLQASNGGWRVETSRGSLRADRVVVCTNARSRRPVPMLRKCVVPLRVCQIATAPLSAKQRAPLLGQGQCLSDTRRNLFTYRFDPQWRLISGGMPLFPVVSGLKLARRIADRLRAHLQLEDIPPPEYIWLGDASVTADRLPAVFELDPGVYALTACNGRGLALSTQLSQSLARALTGGSLSDLSVELTRPQPLGQRRLQTAGARLYSAYGQLRDTLGI